MSVPVRVNDPTVIEVALGGRAYSIFIGRDQLLSLGERIAGLRPGSRVVIIGDETVARHYLPTTQTALAVSGLDATCITVPAGESSKSFAVLEKVCEEVIAARIERGDLIFALGGGVIGDLAGFAAAIVRRGIDYVQVPTTLLAQVDSSIGGKTAIDSRQGKNLVGAFHQPILVVSDTALLDSLPRREFCAGYAEVAKYGLMADAGFFSWLEANWPEVFAGGHAREHAIAASCRMKAAIVAEDERETGRRALLNLGHTFGHALEAAAGFSGRLLHGEAISVGMTLAFAFSAKSNLLSVAEAEQVKRHLAAVGLPTDMSCLPDGRPSADRLMDLMLQDKKVRRGKLTLILARGIGEGFIAADLDASEVHEFLKEKLSEPTPHGAGLVIVIICLLLSAFFAGSETALTASSRASMHRLEKHGDRRAALVNRLLAGRERLIGAVLFGNNAVNIAASSLATGVLLSWFGDVGVVYATVVMTLLIVILAEVLPKTAAFNAPDRFALWVARPMHWAVRVLAPLLIAMEWIVKWLLWMLGMRLDQRESILPPHERLRGAVDLLHRKAVSRGWTATCSAGS
jgi:3-dehydroquinate synthase